jgi:hypothetical protein
MITMTLAGNTSAERHMQSRLRALLRDHPLDPWTFTGKVRIAEGDMPHSHPVLTMNTAYADNSVMALSEFLHEQLHWFEEAHAGARDRFIAATHLPYPEVPAARPEGAGCESSTRLHLLVCHIEHQALASLIGRGPARAAMRRLSTHHYNWVYRTILRDEARLAAMVRAYGLLPAVLRRAMPSDRCPRAGS